MGQVKMTEVLHFEGKIVCKTALAAEHVEVNTTHGDALMCTLSVADNPL